MDVSTGGDKSGTQTVKCTKDRPLFLLKIESLSLGNEEKEKNKCFQLSVSNSGCIVKAGLA